MRKLFSTLALIAVFSACANPAQSGDTSRQFSADSGKLVMAAMEEMKADNYEAAIVKLEQARSLTTLNAYERSTILQMLGQAHYESDDVARAIQNFESAINSGGLLPNAVEGLQVNIAQLYIINGDYAAGAQKLEDFSAAGGDMTDRLVMTTLQAWIQAEQYDRALPWAEQEFAAKPSVNKSDFETLYFLYTNTGETAKRDALRTQAAAQSIVLPKPDGNTVALPDPAAPKLDTRSFKLGNIARDAQPLVRIPPMFPPGATTSGHCNMRFDVSPEGTPFNVQTTSCSDNLFQSSAIKSVKQWKYNPKIRDGKAVSRTGVENKVTYRLMDEAGNVIPE